MEINVESPARAGVGHQNVRPGWSPQHVQVPDLRRRYMREVAVEPDSRDHRWIGGRQRIGAAANVADQTGVDRAGEPAPAYPAVRSADHRAAPPYARITSSGRTRESCSRRSKARWAVHRGSNPAKHKPHMNRPWSPDMSDYSVAGTALLCVLCRLGGGFAAGDQDVVEEPRRDYSSERPIHGRQP